MDLRAPSNYKESHYYYYVLFHIDRGSYKHYKVIEIPVEYAVLFPTNNTYSILQGGQLKVKSLSSEEVLKITIPYKQEIKRLKDIISTKHFKHSFGSKKDNKRIDFTERIGNQYIFVGNSNQGKVVIPCNIIASAFYFTSTRVVRHIFENTLSKTYKKLDIKGDRFIYYAKSGFADADIPRIIHFVIDNYAKDKVYKLSQKFRKSLIDTDISKHLRSSDRKRIYVYAEFPFYGTYEFKVRFHKAGDFLFIDRIIQHGKLPYDRYNIEVVREKVERINTDEEPMPVRIENPSDVEDILTLEHPNKSIKEVNYRLLYEEALLVDKMKRRIITIHKKGGKKYVFEQRDKAEGVSTEPSTKTTDKPIAKANIQRERAPEPKDSYDLEAFKQLLKKLEEFEGLNILEIEENTLPYVKGKRGKRCNKLEYYDTECSNRRRYLYVYLIYKGKHVLLIEIDQGGLKSGTSTFVLIRAEPFKDRKAMAELILRRYLKKVKKEQIQGEFMRHFGIRIYYKKHPLRKIKGTEESWCKGIIEKIQELN